MGSVMLTANGLQLGVLVTFTININAGHKIPPIVNKLQLQKNSLATLNLKSNRTFGTNSIDIKFL